MRKYVYLFELDSVRKTDAEIIAGQKALYNEIITNGNIVVMTYNQIVDSRGFLVCYLILTIVKVYINCFKKVLFDYHSMEIFAL